MMRTEEGTTTRAGEPTLVAIAAGGTGGHVFPAEALIERLVARGVRTIVLTDRRAAERHFDGVTRYVLSSRGVAGRGLIRGAKGAFSLARATFAARRILACVRPEAIVGFGGYPSVAPLLAARSLTPRPRIVVHEQNAVLGRANRLLSHVADAVALGFRDTQRAPRTAVYTGTPVRTSVAAYRAAPYTPPRADGPISLLVLGGSLGARIFSDLVPRALIESPMRARLRITQQCRAEDIARVEAAYGAAGIAAELSTFFPDVARRMTGAHLVIARAGASTIAELSVIGRPQLLVPLPHAIDDHQRANARAAVASGAAVLLDQVGLSVTRLAAAISELIADPETLRDMAAACAPRPSSAEALADLALGQGALALEGVR